MLRSACHHCSNFYLKRALDDYDLYVTPRSMADSVPIPIADEKPMKPKIRVKLDDSWRNVEGTVIAEETPTKIERPSTTASSSTPSSGATPQATEARPMEVEVVPLVDDNDQKKMPAHDASAKLAAQKQELVEAKAMKELHERAKDDAAGPTSAPRARSGARSASQSSGASRSSTSSSSSTSTRSRGRSRRRRAQRRTRARSAPKAARRAWPPALPMLGHQPLHSETIVKRNRRPKKMKRFVVDFCRVIDCKDFDLEALQNAFRSMQMVVDKSEMVVSTKMPKAQVMIRLDKALAKTIRLFEMGSQFFLCEPLVEKKGPTKESQAPRASPSPATSPPPKKRAHLVPPSTGTPRYWSGHGQRHEAQACSPAVLRMATGCGRRRRSECPRCCCRPSQSTPLAHECVLQRSRSRCPWRK